MSAPKRPTDGEPDARDPDAPLPPDRPPASGKSGGRGGRRPTGRGSGGRPSLEVPIRSTLQLFGGVWASRDPICGGALVQQAPAIAQQLHVLSQTDPNVYRWLDRAMTGGGWGGVILAVFPVANALIEHHVAPAVARRRHEGEEPEPPEGPNRVEITGGTFGPAAA